MLFIGWLSAFLFIICGIPQAMKSYQDGNANGVSSAFLIMWYVGEVLGAVYALSLTPIPIPILTNYIFSIIVVTIIMRYKYFPRITKEKP